MRVLIIDNSLLIKRDNDHFTNSLNGAFFSELINKGHELTCVQFAKKSTDNISVYGLEQNGIRCVELPYLTSKSIRYLLSIPHMVAEILDSDFVYLFYPNSLRLVTFLCRMFCRPYGLYLRGMNGVDDRVSKLIYKKAAVVFTVSDSFTDMVNGITHLNNSYTIRPMIPYCDDDIVWNRDYSPKSCYSILFLGRVAKDKGITELIEAAKMLHESGHIFELHIVGSGGAEKFAKSLVDNNDMGDYVSLDGPVFREEEKARYYRQADLYILPTYHEGFPRTLYEAMIFGTPIITTFVGGIPTLMKDGENCKRIEPRSVDSIVRVLSYAINNYKEMGKMAKNGAVLVSSIVDKKRPTHAIQLNQVLEYYGK